MDGTLRTFLAEALFPLTGLVTAVFLTRRLGPEGYGLLTLTAALIVWAENGIAALFSRATYKLVAEAEDWRPVGAMLVRWHLAVGCGIALLLWGCAASLARLFEEPVLTSYLWLFALDLPLFGLAHAHRNLLVGVGKFRQRALVGASRWLARLVLIVLFVELGFSVPGAICGNIGASLVELLIGRLYIRPPLFGSSPFPARQLWQYSGLLGLSALSLACYNKLDLFALKVLGGTAAQAGLYGAAQNLTVIPSIFALSFSPLLLTTLTRVLRTADLLSAREISRDAMRLVVALLPFAGMTAGAAPEIVDAIFGPTFLPAAPLVAVLIFGALALVMLSVATAVLLAAGKPGWTLAITGSLVPLAALGHFLLIPPLGAIGAVLVTTACAHLGALVAVAAVYALWRIWPPLATVGRSVLICAAAFALAALWPTSGVLLVAKLAGVVFFIGFAFFALGEVGARDIALLRSLREQHAVPQVAEPS